MRSNSLCPLPHYKAMRKRSAISENERFLERLDEMTIPADPCESEFGIDAFEQVVFDDKVYNALSMSIHGQRLGDSAEEEEVE